MMDNALREEVHQLHAQICAGLADPTRILILYALAEQEYYVSELADYLAVPQPTVSRHLKVLRERGLVKAHREAQSVIYALTDRRVIDALDLLRGVLANLLQAQGQLGQTVSKQLES